LVGFVAEADLRIDGVAEVAEMVVAYGDVEVQFFGERHIQLGEQRGDVAAAFAVRWAGVGVGDLANDRQARVFGGVAVEVGADASARSPPPSSIMERLAVPSMPV
jgi:hypothetical protein